jgi:hypothetical protein
MSAKNDEFIDAHITIAMFKFIENDKITFYPPNSKGS